MKRLILLSLTLLLSSKMFAGKSDPWIDIGLRANLATTNLLNSNLIDENNLKYGFSKGFSYGAKLGINFNENVAFGVEGIMTQFGQVYKSNNPQFADWTNTITMNSMEFPILLKFTREEWTFCEAGVKIGLLNKVSDTEKTEGIANMFNTSNISAIFGFGHTIWADGGLIVNFGTRFTYGITDILTEEGKTANFPFIGGFTSSDPSKAYKSTNPVSVGLQLNIDFDLGQIASSSCGRKTKFVLFKH